MWRPLGFAGFPQAMQIRAPPVAPVGTIPGFVSAFPSPFPSLEFPFPSIPIPFIPPSTQKPIPISAIPIPIPILIQILIPIPKQATCEPPCAQDRRCLCPFHCSAPPAFLSDRAPWLRKPWPRTSFPLCDLPLDSGPSCLTLPPSSSYAFPGASCSASPALKWLALTCTSSPHIDRTAS